MELHHNGGRELCGIDGPETLDSGLELKKKSFAQRTVTQCLSAYQTVFTWKASDKDGNKELELNLDYLVEENFELRDPWRSKRKLHKQINPERQCIHCDWTRTQGSNKYLSITFR